MVYALLTIWVGRAGDSFPGFSSTGVKGLDRRKGRTSEPSGPGFDSPHLHLVDYWAEQPCPSESTDYTISV